MEPTPLTLEGEVLTTGPSRKSSNKLFLMITTIKYLLEKGGMPGKGILRNFKGNMKHIEIHISIA